MLVNCISWFSFGDLLGHILGIFCFLMELPSWEDWAELVLKQTVGVRETQGHELWKN